MASLRLFVAVVLILASGCLAKSYKDHKVVIFKIENEEQLRKLQILEMEPGVRAHLYIYI